MPGVSSIIIDKLADHDQYPQRVDYLNDQSRSQFFSTYDGVLLSLEAINEHYQSPSDSRRWVIEENIFDVTKKRYERSKHDVLLDCHTHYVSTPIANWHNAMYTRAKFAFPGVEDPDNRQRGANMGQREFLRHLFLDSCNDHVVLTHVPHRVGPNQTPGMPSVDEMVAFRDSINALGSDNKRILATGNIYCCNLGPGKNRVNFPTSDPEALVDAYKIYPPFVEGQTPPPGWLRERHEDIYQALDEILRLHRQREVMRKPVVMMHMHDENAITEVSRDPDYDPLFLKQLANDFKEINFIVFHAAFDGFTGIADNNEILDNPANIDEFWNTRHLIDAMKPCKNLYLETGQVLHHMLAVNPGLAQKFINCILRDEDVAAQCVWGTDSPWCGPSLWQTIAFERLVVEHEDRKLAMLYRNGPQLFGLTHQPNNSDWIGKARADYQKLETWAEKDAEADRFWHNYQDVINRP